MNTYYPNVAVIDVGSNSIKLLVATLDAQQKIKVVHHKSEEIRLLMGNKDNTLATKAMNEGLDAIVHLLNIAHTFNPKKILIAATSAVREAKNKAVFQEMLSTHTGHTLHILSGSEEALCIANGVIQDPQLQNLKNFCVLDLGGGSLELIHYQDKKIVQASSFPLGCVRLMELFVKEPQLPLQGEIADQIDTYVIQTLLNSNFELVSNPKLFQSASNEGFDLIGLGGVFTIARSMLSGEKNNIHYFNIKNIEQLFIKTATQNLEKRLKIKGLPHSRADLIPTALAITLSLLRLFNKEKLYYSYYNLRFGLAYHLLEIYGK